MIFLLLVLISIALAVAQLRGRWARDLAAPRSALIFGGSAYLAGWLLQVGAQRVLQEGSSVPVSWLLSLRAVLSALLGLALWTALARLAFAGTTRRDLLWIIPFGLLSVLVGANARGMPITAALLATPALIRVRWRREVTPGTTGFVALFGVLFVLLSFVALPAPPGSVREGSVLSAMSRYSDWVRGLALIHIIVALPRLLWGMNLPIRTVKRRLMISHLLTGLVPLALIAIFWGLSTYLSVTAERARIAARVLAEEASELGLAMEAAMASPETAERSLREWGRLEEQRRPGLRIWLRGALARSREDSSGWKGAAHASTLPDGGREPLLVRIHGDPLPGEAALESWPDSLAREGVILLEGAAYLGAVRRLASVQGPGAQQGPAAAILVPSASFLGPSTRRKLDAETFLETRWVVGPRLDGGTDSMERAADAGRTGEGGIAEGPIGSGGQGERGGAGVSPIERGRPSAGAAVMPALEWSAGQWKERRVLLWARVGLFYALRGLARNLRENPFNVIALIFLGVVATLFVLVEVLTLGMVVSMGRSVLRALTALRQGTARLRSGNLRYRIPIEGNDELWNVAESFNEMAADLDKARELEIEKERLEGELTLARQIQARLLPAEAPALPRTELAGLSLPAREVGGDYYDFLPLSGNRMGLIVADVSGKGVGAALLMSSFRASLLSQDLDQLGPARTLGILNAFLHRSVEPGRFVTAFLGVLDPAAGTLIYSNAGHNPPVWLSGDGDLGLLREGGLILGLFKDTVYEQASVQLGAGDLLALYTDGVTEATNEDEEFWGEERLLECLRRRRSASCREILREILRDVRAFSTEVGQSDDLTLLLARWRGPEPAG